MSFAMVEGRGDVHTVTIGLLGRPYGVGGALKVRFMFPLHLPPWDAALGRVFPERRAEHGGIGVSLERSGLNGGPKIVGVLEVFRGAPFRWACATWIRNFSSLGGEVGWVLHMCDEE